MLSLQWGWTTIFSLALLATASVLKIAFGVFFVGTKPFRSEERNQGFTVFFKRSLYRCANVLGEAVDASIQRWILSFNYQMKYT